MRGHGSHWFQRLVNDFNPGKKCVDWVELGWIGSAIQQANPKRLPRFSFLFMDHDHSYAVKTIETHALAFLPHIIFAWAGFIGAKAFLAELKNH